MSRLLTRFWKATEVMLIKSLLSRAVPDAQVDSVVIVKSLGDQYWFLVAPSHYKYWDRFERTYPHWRQVAYRHGVFAAVSNERLLPGVSYTEEVVGLAIRCVELDPRREKAPTPCGG